MLDMLSALLPLNKLSNRSAIAQIMQSNEKSTRFGLVLTQSDAVQLVETRNDALRASGRIEIGSVTIGKIIDAFCDSAFIMQQDYADTIHLLLEVFYYMKNETLDLISDDELIELMKNYFENRCKGSVELLVHRELEQMARNVRYGMSNYTTMEEPETEELDEEES